MANLFLRPSNGAMRDRDGNNICYIWTFRPDISVVEESWFENETESDLLLCIMTGEDGYPIKCFSAYRDARVLDEWKALSHEEILDQFNRCCRLLNKKHLKLVGLGGEIIQGIFTGTESGEG